MAAKQPPEAHYCSVPDCSLYASFGKGHPGTYGRNVVWYCREHLPADFWEAPKVELIEIASAARMGTKRKQGTLL